MCRKVVAWLARADQERELSGKGMEGQGAVDRIRGRPHVWEENRGRTWMRAPAPPTDGLRNRPAPDSILVGAQVGGVKLRATCRHSLPGPVSSRARRDATDRPGPRWATCYGLGTAPYRPNITSRSQLSTPDVRPRILSLSLCISNENPDRASKGTKRVLGSGH
jgi:hypothetical protein